MAAMAVDAIDTGSELVLAERAGALGVVTLNRPAAVNALNLEMVQGMHQALDVFAADDAVRAVLVRGAGERGLCAGGDVRVIYRGTIEEPAVAMEFFAAEYRLDHAIACFPKPYIPFMDGLVLGGGVGISVPGSHRIVCESTRLGMPETGIGFSPDVGGAYFLARSPGAVGRFLSLTGLQVCGADAVYAGLADAFVPASQQGALRAELEQVTCAGDVDDAVERYSLSVPDTDGRQRSAGEGTVRGTAEGARAGRLEAARGWIDEAFSHETVEDILEALQARVEGAGEAAGQGTLEREALDAMRRNSPTGMKTALEAIERARQLSLADTYRQDYRLCGNAVLGNRRGGAHATEVETRELVRPGHDMREGIRAQIIDKDRNPQWNPATLEGVTAELVESFFAEVPGFPELEFPK